MAFLYKRDRPWIHPIITVDAMTKCYSECAINIEIQEPVKMKTPQEKAAELLPFVQALANGEEVLEGEHPATGNFIHGIVFSIKPKIMLVNGFEVPEPMRVKLDAGKLYFVPDITEESHSSEIEWEGDNIDLRWLSRGLCHSTKEAAIAHAKAMLGIDPKGGE